MGLGMTAVASNILLFFAVCCSTFFLFRLIKDKSWKELRLINPGPSLAKFLLVVLPLTVALAFLLPLAGGEAPVWLYFFAAAVCGFLLQLINLPTLLRGVLLLGISLTITLMHGAPSSSWVLPVVAAIAGLLTWKLSDNLLISLSHELDDVLPSLCWLTGWLWVSINEGSIGGMGSSEILGLILAALGSAYLVRLTQGPFMSDDKWLIKRIILSICGGLYFLIVVNKLLLLTKLGPLAMLVGAGFLAVYLVHQLDAEAPFSLKGTQAIPVLLLIGLISLLTMRLYGFWGLLILAPTSLVCLRSGVGLFLGYFFCGRVLVQAFEHLHNANLTGINLTHVYVGASLYAGLFLAFMLGLMLKFNEDKVLRAFAFLGCGCVLPAMLGYMLHAEAMCGFYVSCLVSCLLMSLALPALTAIAELGAENLILLSPLMSSIGLLTGSLLEIGETASVESRLYVLGYLAAAGVALSLIYRIARRFRKNSISETSAG